MSKDISEEEWKQKFYEEKQKHEELEKQFEYCRKFYEAKSTKFDIQNKQLAETKFDLEKSLKKCERKKDEIVLLKEEIEYKNKEIKELKVDLENANEKIARLRKHRNQSVMEIRDLEVKLAQEDEKMNILVQTPKSYRKKEKKKKLTIQRLETISTRYRRKEEKKAVIIDPRLELERLLEVKEDELAIEFQKNRELTNVNLKLKHDLFLSNEEAKSLMNEKKTLEKLCEEIRQAFHSKLETFTEKITFLIRENEDLKRNLRDYQERDSGFNTSEHESIGNLGDELSKLSGGSKLIEKSFEDYLRFHEFSHFQLGENQAIQELKSKNQKLEELLKISNSQCKKLKEKLNKHRKASEILNKKLKENLQAMEYLKNNYDTLFLASEVKKLVEEKNRLQEEVARCKNDISTNITKGSSKKPMSSNRSYLEDLPNHGPLDLMNKPNCPSRYHDDKKRRNIASWGYSIINPIN